MLSVSSASPLSSFFWPLEDRQIISVLFPKIQIHHVVPNKKLNPMFLYFNKKITFPDTFEMQSVFAFLTVQMHIPKKHD